MIAGTLTVVAWVKWMKKPVLATYDTGLPTLYEIIPGLTACVLVTVSVSPIGKVLSSVITERFEKAGAEYKAMR